MSTVSIDQITNLAENWGVPIRWAEKIVRLSTVLQMISKDPFLKDSLVFMGGTALNFGVLGDAPPRLSFDLDFNFRESDDQTTPLPMNEVMSTTHDKLQNLLLRLNYSEENVNYKSRFELGQYYIQYRTLRGDLDTIKIEICYSRRIPLLQGEREKVVRLRILDNVEARLPAVEELCGEKIAAFVKRKFSRDAFDIYHIAKAVERGTVNSRILRKCALVCILYQEIDPREVDWDQLFEKISFDTYLQNTLTDQTRISEQQFNQMKLEMKTFLKSLYSDFKEEEQKYLDKYFREGEFHPELIDPEQEFHPNLANQSEIQWILAKRKNARI